MENHHFQWVDPLFLWPFSIVFCLPEGKQIAKLIANTQNLRPNPEVYKEANGKQKHQTTRHGHQRPMLSTKKR